MFRLSTFCCWLWIEVHERIVAPRSARFAASGARDELAPAVDDRGQATAEYALVLLGAAAVAIVLITWATKSGKVTQLLDGVIDKILSNL